MGDPEAKPKYLLVDRSQTRLLPLDYNCLIPADHPARGIWKLLEGIDLTAFDCEVRSFQGRAGRPRISPHLLASVWIYGYRIGVPSARALERMMSWEPGLRWLCADQEVNHHTLSDFRMKDKSQLDTLLAKVLTALQQAGLVDLKLVTQDGTKIRARAGKQSMRRRGTIEGELQAARDYIDEMDRQASDNEALDERHRGAQARAARERLARMEACLKELEAREQRTPAKKRDQIRISTSETEAPKMKHPDGSYAPSRNVQFSTDAKAGVIVAVTVTTDANDIQQAEPAIAEIEKNCGQKPECLLADNGYASRSNVEAFAQRQVEFIAPWKDEKSRQAGAAAANGVDSAFAASVFVWDAEQQLFLCPAGKPLKQVRQGKHHGQTCEIYAAAAEDCGGCADRSQCCGKKGGPRQVRRRIESEAMQTYLERMEDPKTQELYKRRSQVAETPHMRIKENWKWRRFSVRGLANSVKEAIWVALAYNVQVWTRLCWIGKTATIA
jgi:transposase